jgi:hypothetical protein
VAEAKSSSKGALTRGKAILIGVLAIALVVILYVQFGGGGQKPADKPVGYRPPRPAVVVQPGSSAANSLTLASAKTPSITQSGKDKDSAAMPPIDVARWKSPKLETITAHDPFALPPSFPQPPKNAAFGAKGATEGLIAAAAADDAKKLAEAVEKRVMQLEELKQRGVHVIVGEGDQYVAWIGDRKLHVGDEINGFTVTAIDPDGGVSIVEKKESP